MARHWKKLIKQFRRAAWAWSWTLNTPRFDPPPYWTRWRNRQGWSMIPVFVLWMVAPLIVLLYTGTAVSLIFLLQGVGWILFIAVNISWVIAGNRLRMRLARQRFQVCLDCAYSLRGLPERGHCPECGIEYEMSKVTNVWRGYIWTKSRQQRSKPPRRTESAQT